MEIAGAFLFAPGVDLYCCVHVPSEIACPQRAEQNFYNFRQVLPMSSGHSDVGQVIYELSVLCRGVFHSLAWIWWSLILYRYLQWSLFVSCFEIIIL